MAICWQNWDSNSNYLQFVVGNIWNFLVTLPSDPTMIWKRLLFREKLRERSVDIHRSDGWTRVGGFRRVTKNRFSHTRHVGPISCMNPPVTLLHAFHVRWTASPRSLDYVVLLMTGCRIQILWSLVNKSVQLYLSILVFYRLSDNGIRLLSGWYPTFQWHFLSCRR